MKNSGVRVFEVAPRDGLQNVSTLLSLPDKVWLIESLAQAGLKDIEIGAFVRADRVPQMKNTENVFSALNEIGVLKTKKIQDWCLVPNLRGLERAINAGATGIALFTAATETFTERNMGMSIRESLLGFERVIGRVRSLFGSRMKIRGYISTAFGCPFEGKVKPVQALKVIEKLWDLGVDEISIGDTIGVATPLDVKKLIPSALKILGVPSTAVHFHDTRGTALANTLQSLDLDVKTVDSSAGGLGGCPFAPGAAGNLATEDLVYMLNGMGIKSGVDLDYLSETSIQLAQKLKRPVASRYVQSYFAKKQLEAPKGRRNKTIR